ncbi:MAG: guanylate kinase [Parasporobacterium sp.]|nr:guanylate kinase [Parasporobacterium sp.]
MGKLFILIGKSASGKDSVYKRLLEDPSLKLVPYVGFTTRPIRSGEQEGREYHFVTWKQLREYEASGRLIEKRVYHTVHGDWCYFSVDTEHVDLSRHDYLYIGTLESYLPLRSYYGEDRVIPLYLQVDDGVRLQRALDREKSQESPKYAEMCRRFVEDGKDFSEERLAQAGISRRFDNTQFDTCIQQICEYIRQWQRSEE